VADDFERGASTTIYRFRRDGQSVSAYQPSADAPAVRCGDIVRIEGVRLGDTMTVSRAEIAGRSAGDAGCATVGEQRVAVILVTFPGTSLPAAAKGGLRQLMFDGSSLSAHTWYRDQSYGKVSLRGDVFGPYVLDQAYSCGQTAQMQAAAIRAADRDIDFREYQRYILVFPPIRDCIFGAMATLGCREIQSEEGRVGGSWVWSNYMADSGAMLSLLIHEFGHNLGMGHSRLLRFPGEALEADGHRGVPLEYGDNASVMGNARFGGFAASHRLAAGWLAAETDVGVAERNGNYVVAPLESGSGVRALRVRRRIGADEWLWLEYRPGSPGSGGAVIRRETPESGAWTHLLDMTAASSDEARFDMGVGSEANPFLQAWSTWSDPHSDPTITLGEERAEGLDVFIRYDERCAAPDVSEVTVPDWEQELALPVAAAPGCEWQVKSGRTWMSVTRNAGEALVKIGAIPDSILRSGVLTLGRNTVRIVQKAPPRDMTLLSVSPPGVDLPVEASVPILFHLRDENGVEDMQAIRLSVAPRPGSAAAPCYFRYSWVRRVVEVSSDGEVFHDDEKPGIGYSGSCSVEALIYRVNRTDVIFRFFLNFTGPEGEALTAMVRAEDAAGAAGPWVQAAEFQTTRQCRALPTADYLTSGDSLTVRASLSPCAWTATTDVDWIRLGVNSSNDGGLLPFDVAANAEAGMREGHIFINGAPVRVIQYSDGAVQRQYVTLRPPETVISGEAGVGMLTFYYGLGDVVPAEAEVAWLRVLRVERAADRREIRFLAEQNPEPTPRVGTILVGGKPFTVLQQAGPVR